MYGLNELKNDQNDDELSSLSSKTSKFCNSNLTFRNNLQNLLHSYRFHLVIVGLVILDCLIVVIELMIDLQIIQSESKSTTNNTHNTSDGNSHSTAHAIAEILHYLSIGILCIFTTEIIFKVYAFRIEYFSHKAEVFDAFIVITSLTLDIVFIKHQDILRYIGLVIVLRLWRVIRVIHGIIISVKTPLEHSFEKEKKLREKFEKELAEQHLYINSLEIEITTLRTLLKKNGIVNDVPQTYIKKDRKV